MEENLEKILKTFSFESTKNIQNWLKSPFVDSLIKEEIISLAKSNPKELQKAFSSHLAFGTAGARALMGVGTSKINVITISLMTQALVNYLQKLFGSPLKIAIGYDNRQNSYLFAKKTAEIILASGHIPYLFEHLCPTFMVSFATLKLNCHSGVMITASHNPPEYNGYKVYFKDGGQILPSHDGGIIQEMEKLLDLSSFFALKLEKAKFEMIKEDFFEDYLNELNSLNLKKKITLKKGHLLKIVYTNLHGTGITLLPKAFKQFGFSNLHLVKEQEKLDPFFTNAPLPNPEEESALKLGTNKLLKEDADILLATDPDSDRIGLVAKENGSCYRFSGQELASLLLFHLCKEHKIPKNGAVVRSFVTTELFDQIAKDYHLTPFVTLTGFKYIAEYIEKFSKGNDYTFFFGAEESFGYLAETFLRDKDGVSTALLIAEMALLAKINGKTLLKTLYEIFEKYGAYKEKIFSQSLKDENQLKKIKENFRSSSFNKIGYLEIVQKEDYDQKIVYNFLKNTQTPTSLPKTHAFKAILSDESSFLLRPSGTEPKIKIYLSTREKVFESVENTLNICDQKLDVLLEHLKNTLLN